MNKIIDNYRNAGRRLAVVGLLAAWVAPAAAHEILATDRYHLNLDIEALAGVFHSEESYASAGWRSEGSTTWQEGYVKYGLSGDARLGGGELFGALNFLSSGTWGDGDAAGFTDGSERTTTIEDAYLGWRSGDLLPALGQNGVMVSAGRQAIVVGDGFLISGDALNFGSGIGGGAFSRGGAYYLAARKAFDRTAVLRIGGEQGWRSDLMWLQSDNAAQARAEIAVGTLEHVGAMGTFGVTYIDVLDVDSDLEFLYPQRRDMQTVSLRFQGNAGVPNLFLSAEYVWQDQDQGNENAWYVEAGWNFVNAPWSPSVHYRFSRFSNGYDPLFYGNGRALGTWFQGEVAANYAGPFNSNARVHTVQITASPRDNVAVGVLMYDFQTVDESAGPNIDGREVDVYAQWALNPHLAIIPLVGWYKPDVSAADGGTQLGNNSTSMYSQILLSLTW